MQSTEPIKERFQKRLGSMQAPVVLAPAEPGGQVALFEKHPLGSPEVAVEKPTAVSAMVIISASMSLR